MRAKITLQSVKALKPSEALYDTELKGFQVRRQAKAIVYAVRRMVGKRNLQITIGEHGAWTPDKARKEAERLLRELGVGNDPRATRVVEPPSQTLPPTSWTTFGRSERLALPASTRDISISTCCPSSATLPLDRITTAGHREACIYR